MNKALAALLSWTLAAAPVAAQTVSVQLQPAPSVGGVSSAAPLPEASMAGPAALSDYFDIKNTAEFPVGMQDLRAMQPDTAAPNLRGSEPSSRPPTESFSRQDRPASSDNGASAARQTPAAANSPVAASAALSEVPAPGETVKARLMLLPEPGAARDAPGPAAYPAAASADMERKAVLMSTLFDGAQLEAGMQERVPSSVEGRLQPPSAPGYRAVRGSSLLAGSSAAPALSAAPAQRPGPPPSSGGVSDLSSDQAARALGGAAGSMLVTGAGALALTAWYAPGVVLQWERDILTSKKTGPVQKAVYAGLLPAAVALSVGLSPFAGGLLGLFQGYEDGKEAGFRRAIDGARSNVRGVKRRLKGLVELLKEEGQNSASSSSAASIVERARSLREPKGPGGLLAAPEEEKPRDYKEMLPTLGGLLGIVCYLAVKEIFPYAGFEIVIASIFAPFLAALILKAILSKK